MNSQTYLSLVKRFPLRPLKSEQQLQRAIQVVDSLLKRPSLSKDEDDYLDVLSDLIHKYENAVDPIAPAPDSAMLEHLMEARDLSRAELHRQTGIGLSTIAEVLNGKRSLTRRHVAVLSRFFNVSADAFAPPGVKGSDRGLNGSSRLKSRGRSLRSSAKKRGQ